MRRYSLKILYLVGTVAVVAAVLYYGIQSRIPKVPVVVVERGPAERVLSIVGRVMPKQEVSVRAEQPGQVIELLKDENQHVTAGEVIARVAAEEEIATLSASRAEAIALAAELARANNQLTRTRELVQKGFVSTQNLDDVLSEVDALKARLDAARAAERQVAVRAEKFVIRSPIDGLVLARPVDVGQVVSTETGLFDIGSVELEVEAEADEYYADALQLGQSALINPAGSAETFNAVVSEISPRVDPTTGGRIVRLETEATADSLLPGRTINTSIIVEQLEDAVSVPRSAVQLQGGRFQALVVEQNRIHVVPVEIFDWPGPRVIITAGLQGKETVVASATSLAEGDEVHPLDSTPPTAP
ncbi:Multidrug resistance protein MdtA [Halioglobus japonicus]|nr:Multidrug resistance protein MdtA [Halioglobus japonicus]